MYAPLTFYFFPGALQVSMSVLNQNSSVCTVVWSVWRGSVGEKKPYVVDHGGFVRPEINVQHREEQGVMRQKRGPTERNKKKKKKK